MTKHERQTNHQIGSYAWTEQQPAAKRAARKYGGNLGKRSTKKKTGNFSSNWHSGSGGTRGF